MTPDPLDLLGFLALGVGGALHCAGMCGGFALAATAGAHGGGRLWRALSFGLGKASTYVILGLLLVTGVRAAGGAAEGGLPLVRAVVAWLVGAVLVLGGLHAAGLLPRSPGGGEGRGGARAALSRAVGRALDAWRALLATTRGLGGGVGAFGTGVLVGFLPCGLSWAALALASRGDPATASLGLLLFGLATTPALAAVALGGALLRPRVAAHLQRALGVGLILLGVVTVARGGFPDATDAHAACPLCEDAAAPATH